MESISLIKNPYEFAGIPIPEELLECKCNSCIYVRQCRSYEDCLLEAIQ